MPRRNRPRRSRRPTPLDLARIRYELDPTSYPRSPYRKSYPTGDPR